jgi:hypothetical protein
MAVQDFEYQLALATTKLLTEVVMKLIEKKVLTHDDASAIFENAKGELFIGSGGKNELALNLLAEIQDKVGL